MTMRMPEARLSVSEGGAGPETWTAPEATGAVLVHSAARQEGTMMSSLGEGSSRSSGEGGSGLLTTRSVVIMTLALAVAVLVGLAAGVSAAVSLPADVDAGLRVAVGVMAGLGSGVIAGLGAAATINGLIAKSGS